LTNALVQAAATIAPVLTFDSTTAKATRSYAIGVDYVAATTDVFSAQNVPGIDALTLTRDGSSFSVNSTGISNTIKITDMSGSLNAATGKISVVAYDAAGLLAAGTAPVIPSLTKNSTVTIAVSTLVAAFPSAVRFDFTVESTQIVASNVKKTQNGVTVTTYRNATGKATTSTNTPGAGAL